MKERTPQRQKRPSLAKTYTRPRDAAWYRRTFHVAWAQLAASAGMSKQDYEPIYRDILRQCGATNDEDGNPSQKNMTVIQLEHALEEFKKRGFKLVKSRVKTTSKTVKTTVYDTALLDKAFGIWKAMADFGIVANASRSAFEAWALKRIKADHLKWITDTEKEQLVEALKQWAKRKGCSIFYDDVKNSWVKKNAEMA
jgi:phage gp16-like protein